jgi:hypothetical protein
VYRSLLNMVPGLEERLVNVDAAEIRLMADLVSRVICAPALSECNFEVTKGRFECEVR